METNNTIINNIDNNKKECVHYWILGRSNDEGICIGICKKCKNKKEFIGKFKEITTWALMRKGNKKNE